MTVIEADTSTQRAPTETTRVILRIAAPTRTHLLPAADALGPSNVGELAAGLAHELNQPLTSISYLAEACSVYLQPGSIDTAKPLELLSQIVNECARAAAIIAHLRSLVAYGEAQLELVDLRAIVEQVPRLLVRRLETARIALRINLPLRPMRVDGDRIQLEQVIVNLLQNAIDSIEEADGPQRVVTLSVRSIGGMGEVSVHDTGTGVVGRRATRMFDRYFTTKSKGLGVGLSLCRSIINAHHGCIWLAAPAESESGALVRFAIPLKVSPRVPRRRRENATR